MTGDGLSGENANGNSNRNAYREAINESVSVPEKVTVPTPEPESVTISKAAETLGVTLPRLARLLKRPEFAASVSKGERQTRTGTRTVTLVRVSVLDALRRALFETENEAKTDDEAKEEAGPEQKRKQKREHLHGGDERYRYRSDEGAREDGSGQLPALAQMLLSEREARLADKDAEIARLSRTLADTQAALKLAQENLQREQTLRFLPAPQEIPAAPEAVETVETAESPAVAAPRATAEAKADQRKEAEPADAWGRVKRWFLNA